VYSIVKKLCKEIGSRPFDALKITNNKSASLPASFTFFHYLGPVKGIQRVTIFGFSTLLILALLFWKERALFVDASYILFRIVNLDELQIQEHRYGSFITQAFPLFAARLHLPVTAVVLLYSISFNLFYFLAGWLVTYRLRQPLLGVLMLFYYLLMVSDSFYWTNNEVHQGIAWMFIMLAALLYFGEKRVRPLLFLPFFFLLSFLAIFTHPLVIFPLGFLWTLLYLQPSWPFGRAWTAVFTTIILVLAYIKYRLSTGAASSHYDVEKLEAVKQVNSAVLKQALTSPMIKELAQRTIWNYWLLPILSIAGIIAAIRKKAWIQTGLALAFSGIYIVLVCLTFRDFIPFYTESEWMAGSIIFTALFVFYLLPALPARWATALVAAIVLVRIGYIGFASEKFVARRYWLEAGLERMRQSGATKGLVPETSNNQKLLIMNWGVPSETMIASALAGEYPQRTFVVKPAAELQAGVQTDNKEMIAPFEVIRLSRLNTPYFQFDTAQNYKEIPLP